MSVVSPTRSKGLPRVSEELAKTDATDAHLIAEYAFLIPFQP